MQQKIKIQVETPDGPIIHGVIHAKSIREALDMLSIPSGYTLVLAEQVHPEHACFYDKSFERFVKEGN